MDLFQHPKRPLLAQCCVEVISEDVLCLRARDNTSPNGSRGKRLKIVQKIFKNPERNMSQSTPR